MFPSESGWRNKVGEKHTPSCPLLSPKGPSFFGTMKQLGNGGWIFGDYHMGKRGDFPPSFSVVSSMLEADCCFSCATKQGSFRSKGKKDLLPSTKIVKEFIIGMPPLFTGVKILMEIYLPKLFELMVKEDTQTVLEWYVKVGDIVEPGAMLVLLDVWNGEHQIPTPPEVTVPHRVIKLGKNVGEEIHLGDFLISLEPVK